MRARNGIRRNEASTMATSRSMLSHLWQAATAGVFVLVTAASSGAEPPQAAQPEPPRDAYTRNSQTIGLVAAVVEHGAKRFIPLPDPDVLTPAY
jgi:hypothetical protein